VSAHGAYDRLEAGGAVDDDRLDRLTEHVETVVDGLTRETDTIRGLVRYEGDTWRQDGQNASKVWTVSTAWGAHACGELAALLADRGDPRSADIANRARDLLACIAPRGPLCAPTGYLPEQFFDDGTPDSATPLGWPHAIRLATVGLLDATDRLAVDELAASR
jgi:GH15 family glucan-1,4-alpha-glucosidase